jgi:acetolactate synthase-1/2/3 large subunit
MKNQLDGGEAIVEGFRRLGVEYILSSPGTEWAPVWEAMADQIQQGKNGPKLLDVWHETLAVDMACGYTLATGKMQGVLLHAGSGLLQGAMGIHAAYVAGIPMVVISGESMTYGEQSNFDPGAQWINNLSIVGGTTHLVDSIVKYASIAGSASTVYESVVRAGELAQRTPPGPTYLAVSTETLMDNWTPPNKPRAVPNRPRLCSDPSDLDRVSKMICQAKNPVVLTESAGREVGTYNALIEFCENTALPVVEKPGALFANFPRDHGLHLGTDFTPFWDKSDLVLVIRNRVPWYPPSASPPNATVVVIDENPHNSAMVYQSLQADVYLEGDVEETLREISSRADIDKQLLDDRKAMHLAAHNQLVEQRAAKVAEAKTKDPIDPIWVCACLNAVMPDNTAYIDEVTTHTGLLRQYLNLNKPQTLFTRQGGLGQGLGISLGVKLAFQDRPVVTLIGDGAFLYNPALGSLGASRDFSLPTMTVVFNNKKYAAMQGMHHKMYPDGTAVATDVYHGTHIHAPDFVKVAESVGGYGEQVADPDRLEDALRDGLAATMEGKPVIIDVLVG